MKRGRYPYPYPPVPYKKKSGAVFIVVIVLIVVAVFFANSKGIIHLNLPSLNLGLTNGTSPVQLCNQAVNSCGGIINSKYGANVSILNTSEIKSGIEANKFLKVWSGGSQLTDIAYYKVTAYPIVLVATRFDEPGGSKSPHVFVCNSTGSLNVKSTESLC